MADAIVLQAVVTLAITAPSDRCVQYAYLLLTCLNRRLTHIILTILTLADVRVTGDAPLQANTVKLAALASLAVASAC